MYEICNKDWTQARSVSHSLPYIILQPGNDSFLEEKKGSIMISKLNQSIENLVLLSRSKDSETDSAPGFMKPMFDSPAFFSVRQI